MLEIIITGHVGSLRFAQAGTMQVLNLSVASSRRINDREFTDWVSCKVWGERAAKLQQHIQKGAKLLLRGRPEAKGYQRQDGTMAGELVLHVRELEFLSPKTNPTENGGTGEDELPLSNEKKPKRRGKA